MKKLKYLLILVLFVSLFYSAPISFAKFKAIKSLEGTIIIPENNFCLNNNIDTLSDCMLVMDSYSNSVSSAKTAIQAKGTPNFSKIAPQISYRQSGFVADSATFTTNEYYNVSDSYTFTPATGKYSLTNPTQTVIDSNMNSYVDKYTCASTSNSCDSLYKIVTDTNDGTTYSITSLEKNNSIIYEVFDSDNGLYSATDDLGTSYYYRGSVKNNIVEFAGMYWRIVRRDGSGNVRLIYYGSSPSVDSGYSTSCYNVKHWDPTFVGFMNNERDFSATAIESSTTVFQYFTGTSNYYFSKEYNDNGSRFTLLNNSNSDVKFDSIENIHDELMPETDELGNTTYYYTCINSNINSSCPVLFRIIGYNSSSSISVQMISHSSTSYNNAIQNVTNSDILDNLNNFWNTHFVNVQDSNNDYLTDYISDAIYCNDRTLKSNTLGNGYSLVPGTYYGPYERFYGHSPSFLCPNLSNDGFTVNGSSYGNNKLTNSIGLLTIDEAMYAGVSSSSAVSKSYIVFPNSPSYWTMSPAWFANTYRNADIFRIENTGYVRSVGSDTGGMVLKPVITLKSTVKITGGDGTSSNPYTLSLQ